MKTHFKKLFVAIKAESEHQFDQFRIELDKETEVSKILDKWFYNELITAGAKKKEWAIAELKTYLMQRRQKKDAMKLQAKFDRLQQIGNAGKLKEIDISIEWKRSRMWGNNPTAEVRVRWQQGEDYRGDNYTSGSIGGCGYDKESTAIADAVNQSPEFLKAMYTLKEKNADKKNHELFGYGSGYGILPNLEGGVGVSCYPKIFAKIGYTFKGVSHGKTFDVYSVTKGVKKTN